MSRTNQRKLDFSSRRNILSKYLAGPDFKVVIMQKNLWAVAAILFISFAFACGGSQNAAGGSSPTDSYKRLFAAVKSKDTEAIKKQLTKKTLELGVTNAQRVKKPLEQVYENGFTATTFSETLPNIRDERIKDDMGSVEVWNSKESKWEDLPFIKEEGAWKLAIGDLFAGSYVTPGPGRDYLEKQASNAVANTTIQLPSNSNSNSVTVANSAPAPPKPDKKAK